MEQQPATTGSRDQFRSRIGFIFAAAGSAVGLGNIWKFPYLAGTHGGGAFVVIYLACIVLIGFSLMLMEFALGRNTSLAAAGAFRKLDKRFTFIGIMGVFSAFLIMGFYPVVGGWSLSYIAKTVVGELAVTDAEALGGVFGNLISGSFAPIFWTALYMILNIVIVAGGIGAGIEKAAKFMMPALFVLLIILGIRSVTLPGAGEGLAFMFKPDWSALSGEVALAALGQAFFSLSLGMGCMITYSSYLSKKENLVSNAFIIPGMDTLVAILAGVVILPATIAFGFEVGAGPGLVFVTVPAIFATMGPVIGKLFGLLFFVLIALAALTSSISLLEVIVSYLIDEKNMTRKKAVGVTSVILFIMCIAASLSMGAWADFKILGNNIFDTFDKITTYITMPLGALFISLFVGWFWGKENALKEVTNDGTIKFGLFNVWFFLCKWIIPAIIIWIFFSGIGSFPGA
jgi:NSS family neurotransmitter:Na+ symporter